MFGMSIPSVMLAQMYRQGSLANGAEGFGFEVHNPFMDATIVTVHELTVGGRTYGLEAVEFTRDGVTLPGTVVSEDQPVGFRKDEVVAIRVKGSSLGPGAHALRFKVHTEEFGTLTIEVQDTVAEA